VATTQSSHTSDITSVTPPIATSHIVSYEGQQVTYWYIDSNTKQRVTITCSALDFISRLVPHIPPKGMQIVRYAGYHR
jgi:hypothetical protein